MATLTEATLRVTLWNNFKAFLDGITYTDSVTIKGAFNDQDPTLPEIVFPSASMAVDRPTLNGSVRFWMGTLELEFFAGDSLVLDRMLDETQVALDADTDLETDGLQFVEDYWRESTAGAFMINSVKIHNKIITLKFCIKNLA